MQLSESPLYSEDLAPIPASARTWNRWNLAALWVGMAVCIPTYILASYMIRSGLSWQASLFIIFLANLVITLPMVLNGHAGVKYGLPFPVIGRSAFGIRGIHLVALIRGIVACGWFGVQTWVGGMAIFSIWNAATGGTDAPGLETGEFVCFGIFWLVNMYFIWKGTESIKWLEDLSAPILILIGIGLIYWGKSNAPSFSAVLDNGAQLARKTVTMKYNGAKDEMAFRIQVLTEAGGKVKADSFQIISQLPSEIPVQGTWLPLQGADFVHTVANARARFGAEVVEGKKPVSLRFIKGLHQPSEVQVRLEPPASGSGKLWDYLLWFTAMVGFWATMSISISDITRFAKSQKDQIQGQFLGLPGTMLFYSFVGIFVTSASLLAFDDVLIAEDAPWDPVSLVSRFKNPAVVIFAQLAMLIATLSTNIAANVIAPANAFSNLAPRKISFKTGGYLAGLVGILICPWWLMDEISSLLLFVSGLLGPVLGILLSDYFLIRKKQLSVTALFDPNGPFAYGGSGVNRNALLVLVISTLVALAGYWVESLSFLFSLSWFTGFLVSFVLYYFLQPAAQHPSQTAS